MYKNWHADMNCQLAKFHAKRLNRSENIPKSFRGATFLKHPVVLHFLFKPMSIESILNWLIVDTIRYNSNYSDSDSV